MRLKPVAFFLLLLLNVLGVTFFAQDCFAKTDYLARFRKEMPKIEAMPEKEFLEATELIEDRPSGDPALAYSVRVPKEWVKMEDSAASNFQISDKLLSKMAVFFGPASIYGQERIEIQAVTIDFDMDAEQWFIQYLMSVGQTTEGYKFHNKRQVEALMLLMEQDISYVKRVKVVMNGRRVLLMEHYVPVDLWDKSGAMQVGTVNSFKILNPIEVSVVETEPYQILDIARLEYPKFWQENPDGLTSVERIGVRFFNYLTNKAATKKVDKKSTIEGRMDVLLVAMWSATSLIDEIETFRKNAEANDMLIGERISVIDEYKYYETVDFGATEAYKVINNTDNAREYEFWFTLLVSGDYYYFVSLMTPSRNDNYVSWVRNTQSYKILVQNTKPNEKKKSQ